MKKFWLLLFSLSLLVGCGLESAVENTTSSLSQSSNQVVELQATSVWTDMRPISNTPQAGVVFQVETTLKSGESITLYGAGTLTVNDESFVFKDNAPIQGQGQGVVKVYGADLNESDSANSAIYVPRVAGLTAQIDGLKAGPTDTTIDGVVISNNAKEEILEFSGVAIADKPEVQEVGCYGRFLPNSTLAQFIVLWESDKGVVPGGGLIDLGQELVLPSSDPGPFTCTIGSKSLAAATDLPSMGADTGVMLIKMENVALNFSESDQPHQAKTASAILFFDEADALFGKVSDGNGDQYANMEVSHLRQLLGLQP